ncbi:hypothetical protein SAMN05192534_101647, partial [Alteribacillus persepolensis]
QFDCFFDFDFIVDRIVIDFPAAFGGGAVRFEWATITEFTFLDFNVPGVSVLVCTAAVVAERDFSLIRTPMQIVFLIPLYLAVGKCLKIEQPDSRTLSENYRQRIMNKRR